MTRVLSLPFRVRIARGLAAAVALLLALVIIGPPAATQPQAEARAFRPAIVFGEGPRDDGGFNEMAARGVELFTREMAITVHEALITDDLQREQVLARLARDGYDPVIAVGDGHAAPLERIARVFPQTRFVIIDTIVDLPNVYSVMFRDHESSYLAGIAAALATRTRVVGFVGGVDQPLIRRFGCGFAQGVASVDRSVKVVEAFVGPYPDGYIDQVGGAEAAWALMNQQADVVFQAAGISGLGVLEAVATANRLGIGVDANQNGLHPGRVLTSVLKRIDLALFTLLDDFQHGRAVPAFQFLGLLDGGVDISIDAHNTNLLTPDMRRRLGEAREAIMAGQLSVLDYGTTESCPLP